MKISNITVSIALNDAERILQKTSVATYKLDAKILLSHILNLTNSENLILKLNEKISLDDYLKYIHLIERRLKFEPVAYIIGNKDFWKQKYTINKNVLIPRPETELIIELLLKKLKGKINSELHILDLGTGSGCIILSLLSELKFSTGIGIDISEKALNVAKLNAKKFDLIKRVNFKISDWFDNLENTDKFDIIISNPPYIPIDEWKNLDPNVLNFEPKGALTDNRDGLENYRIIANNAKKFLKKVNNYIENKTITGILFITATAFEGFWDMLNKSGIKQLENVNKDTIHNFDKDFENYRSFSEHTIIVNKNETNNPLTYITDLFSKNKIDEKTRKIIFAPAHSYTKKTGVGSHDEIKAYFLGRNYTVLLMNGQFKGFIYPNGKEIPLEDYNNEHSIKGELRNTLKHWSNNNIERNLAITGYNVIERGVTFNTDEFNFTDMILSNYNLKSIGQLIQLAGRSCGAKKYVNIMNIFCTDSIKQEIENRNNRLKEICSLNPELYNRTDFNTSKNAIPVKLEITNEELINKLVELKINHKRLYMLKFHELLVQGINDNNILIHDNNNINRFSIKSRKIKGIRMYQEGEKKEARRFKNFNDAFDNFKTISQTCGTEEYNIDFVKDKYEFNGFVNETNILWITFKI